MESSKPQPLQSEHMNYINQMAALAAIGSDRMTIHVFQLLSANPKWGPGGVLRRVRSWRSSSQRFSAVETISWPILLVAWCAFQPHKVEPLCPAQHHIELSACACLCMHAAQLLVSSFTNGLCSRPPLFISWNSKLLYFSMWNLLYLTRCAQKVKLWWKSLWAKRYVDWEENLSATLWLLLREAQLGPHLVLADVVETWF